MKALWGRLLLAFGLAFAAVSAAFLAAGRFRAADAHLALYGLAVLAAFAAAAGWMAWRLRQPLRALNAQLDQIDSHQPDERVALDEPDADLRALQENINRQLARTQSAIQDLKRYAAQVAHELRTPLTIMRLKIEQAADRIDPRLAEDIQAELLRLSLHVERSLLVARAEQGQLTLDPVRFDLGALLAEAVEDFQLLTQTENRAVRCVRAPAAWITADPKYLKQILYNLLNNALRHGQGDIRVRLAVRGGRVRLLIANQVRGLAADQFNLELGRRIVAAIVGLHGNMLLRSRRLRGWYFVRLVVFARPLHGGGRPAFW